MRNLGLASFLSAIALFFMMGTTTLSAENCKCTGEAVCKCESPGTENCHCTGAVTEGCKCTGEAVCKCKSPGKADCKCEVNLQKPAMKCGTGKCGGAKKAPTMKCGAGKCG